MMSHFDLLLNDDNVHSLLEPTIPPYSSVTVRRACIVWLHCGQTNEFRHVCNYFHYLEMLEDKLPRDARTRSRLHEFSLLSNLPPSSYYLSKYFPKLYRQNRHKINLKQIGDIRFEDCVFNLEGFYDLHMEREVTTKEIFRASQVIRKYCSAYSKSLNNILFEFLEFAKRTQSRNSVSNICVYIKKQYLKDELQTYKNMPKHFSFLDIDEVTEGSNVVADAGEQTTDKKTVLPEKTKTNKVHDNKVTIMITEARRKELINLIPQLSGLTLKDSDNSKFSSQN